MTQVHASLGIASARRRQAHSAGLLSGVCNPLLVDASCREFSAAHMLLQFSILQEGVMKPCRIHPFDIQVLQDCSGSQV